MARATFHPKRVYILVLFCVFILFMSTALNILHPNKPLAFVWPRNQTRDSNLLIHPDRSTTLIQPRNACGSGGDADPEGFSLLVVVCSGVGNTNERRAIRDSWGKDVHRDLRVVFLVGTPSGKANKTAVLTDLALESEIYGDIVQEDFVDSYANLTVKSLMMLKWFSQSCSDKALYLMKTDDDMYVNLVNLYDLVKTNKDPYLMTGSVICGAKPIRDPHNKWYSPQYMFQGKVYPMYLSGTGYVMSGSVAGMLFEASRFVPAFHLEDAYVTGLLRSKYNELAKAKTAESTKPVNLQVKDDLKFSIVKRDPFNTCIFARTITSHHHSPEEIQSIYKAVQKVGNSEKCKRLKKKSLRTYPIDSCWLKATRTTTQQGAIKKMGRVRT